MISLFDNDQIVRAYTKEKVEEGRAEGLAKGEAKGRKEEKKDNVRNLLGAGVSEEIIANALKIPLSEVAAIRASMPN